MERAIRRNEQALILISEGNGFPGNTRVAVNLSRNFWYIGRKQTIGVIGDSNSGPVYSELARYLREYLQTPCKKHNVNPQLTFFDGEEKLTLSFGRRREITIWTLEIPLSLEIQISRVLKSNHARLRRYSDGDETIEAAQSMLGVVKEDIIRTSVGLLRSEVWFRRFCEKLRTNIA